MRDESWALHCAHIRAGYCAALCGPEPAGIFPSPSWREIARALDHELRFIEANLRYHAYCVLNLCRIIYSFESRNVVVSKRFCGRWARDRFPGWRALIQAAIRFYGQKATPQDEKLLTEGVVPFLEFARGIIRRTRAKRRQ